MNSGSALSEQLFLLSCQFQLNDLLDTVLAKDNRNTDAKIRFAVFAFQEY